MASPSVAVRTARSLSLALVLAVAALSASCGTDGGKSSFLPPGEATTAPPGDLVLYVAQAIGDRIDAYRLGTDGLLPEKPFDTIHLDNPRRLAVADGVLYATLYDSVVSIRLGADGSLPQSPTSIASPRNDYDPIDILVDDGVVYVAASGLDVVQSFRLEENGNLPFVPTGSGLSEFSADFLSLAINGRYLYAGARDTQYIDVFLLDQDGDVPPNAEPQDPVDRISLPDDMVIRDGILYVTSAGDRSIHAYIIQPNGFLPGMWDSRTSTEEYYSKIMLDGDTLYAAAYNRGRIDLYNVNPDGSLPNQKPFHSTQGDTASFPSTMLMQDGILYVAQAGLDRIDAYVLGSDGLPPRFPTSSTTPVRGESYSLDMVLYSTK